MKRKPKEHEYCLFSNIYVNIIKDFTEGIFLSFRDDFMDMQNKLFKSGYVTSKLCNAIPEWRIGEIYSHHCYKDTYNYYNLEKDIEIGILTFNRKSVDGIRLVLPKSKWNKEHFDYYLEENGFLPCSEKPFDISHRKVYKRETYFSCDYFCSCFELEKRFRYSDATTPNLNSFKFFRIKRLLGGILTQQCDLSHL